MVGNQFFFKEQIDGSSPENGLKGIKSVGLHGSQRNCPQELEKKVRSQKWESENELPVDGAEQVNCDYDQCT